jgi:hypothetical protein
VPAVAHDEIRAEPSSLVRDLTGEFRPCRIFDGPSEAVVADEVVDGKVLDRQTGVVLDQLARDLMEERATSIRYTGMFPCQLAGGLAVVTASLLGSRKGTRPTPKSPKAVPEWVVGRPAPNLTTVRSGRDGERYETSVYSDELTGPVFGSRPMTAGRMEGGCTDVESYIPAATASSDGGEQDLGPCTRVILRLVTK